MDLYKAQGLVRLSKASCVWCSTCWLEMQAPKCSWASIPSHLCYVTTTTLTSACKQMLATDQVLPTCFNAPSEVRGRGQLLGHLTCGARYWSINLPDEGSLRSYMLSEPMCVRSGKSPGKSFQLTQCSLVVQSRGVEHLENYGELWIRWGLVGHIYLKASNKLHHRPNLLSHLTDASYLAQS